MSLRDIPRPVKTYRTTTYDRLASAKESFDGKGKTILITGGATGIGLAITTSFAEAGVTRIIIVSRSAGPQAQAKKDLSAKFPGLEVVTIQAAVTDAKRIEEVFEQVGEVDVVVLSAAVTHEHVPTLQIPTRDIVDTFNTNILGNFNVVRAFLAQQASERKGKMVLHVSSCAAHFIMPGQVGYGPSKTGFSQVIQCLADEYKDVHFVNLHPGAVLTGMATGIGLHEGSVEWEDVSLPGDFAVWLATSEAKFLRGRFVWANWDVEELLELRGKVEGDGQYLRLGLRW